MPLMLLGLIFAIGLFIYYIMSTSPRKNDKSKETQNNSPKKSGDLKKEENVIFLPEDIEKIKKHHRKNK